MTAPMAASEDRPILRVEDLAVSFPASKAVDGVWLSVFPGRTLAVVGESGSGKSVTALSILRLLPANARMDRGRILWSRRGGEVDLRMLPPEELRRVRGGEVSMVFQEPMTCLNPVFTVGEQIVEAIRQHQSLGAREACAAAAHAMERVGIRDAAARLSSYPHEFSGGMRQRVMIAMALACEARLLIADEPTTALDATVQAQILDLLARLQLEQGLGILLITHALALVADRADAVCVMYRGRVVEYAHAGVLFERPLHPYTRALKACSPRLHSRRERLATIRQVLDEPSAFDDVGGERPWWPDLNAAGTAGYQLAEVEPRHWVALHGESSGPIVPECPGRRGSSAPR